jgi:antitoxin component of MazEF toxin-antitoxin module
MKLILKIVTVGNGVGVVIPKDVMEKLELEKGQRISIEIEEVK